MDSVAGDSRACAAPGGEKSSPAAGRHTLPRNPAAGYIAIDEGASPSMPVSGLAFRGPRSLLRQIREAMAGGASAQTRLDMVVRIIARSMVAEVCSIYLRRASGDMELFATEGLNPESVHVPRLGRDEELEGEIV